MMKKDGKDIYTFTGLINRMDACRHRYTFTEKDIPEEVEFRETMYKLSDDKKFYYDQRTGVTLSEVVGEVYGTDIFQFLTAHEFIVTPKEKIFLTSEEREFLRMCNAMLDGGGKLWEVRTRLEDPSWVCLVFQNEGYKQVVELEFGPDKFKGLKPGIGYTPKELGIYD